MESWVQSWRPRADAFCDLPFHLSKVLRLPRKSDASHMKCCTCHTNHLSKPEDLMLQSATPLRKSAPGPPNSSDEHVSCTASATRNPSLQILVKCPTPAIVFGNATKPSRSAHFWQGAQSLAPATQKHVWTTSKKRSVPHSFLHFWLRNDSKCASRHNCVHFFDISTSKSALNPRVFYTFDFEMCFAPQRRALFRHLNCQKCSGREVLFLAFSLPKCASRHNGAQIFIPHLARWLRTCRFGEPAFRPSGATNH